MPRDTPGRAPGRLGGLAEVEERIAGLQVRRGGAA